MIYLKRKKKKVGVFSVWVLVDCGWDCSQVLRPGTPSTSETPVRGTGRDQDETTPARLEGETDVLSTTPASTGKVDVISPVRLTTPKTT